MLLRQGRNLSGRRTSRSGLMNKYIPERRCETSRTRQPDKTERSDIFLCDTMLRLFDAKSRSIVGLAQGY